MKSIGWIMAILAGVIILRNVDATAENERKANEQPWTTIFSGGSNLKKAYSFTPPYSGFEMIVIGMGLVGVSIIIFAPSKD